MNFIEMSYLYKIKSFIFVSGIFTLKAFDCRRRPFTLKQQYMFKETLPILNTQNYL